MMALSKPYLFSLPPEVRTRIYDHTLVSETDIDLTRKRDRPEPGILTVCRQARKEAAPIYYSVNKFCYLNCNFKGAAIVPFCKKLAKYHPGHTGNFVRVEMCTYTYSIDHQNLKPWLKAYYDDPDNVAVPDKERLPTYSKFQNAAIVCFGVVDLMREKQWEEVAAVLDDVLVPLQHFHDVNLQSVYNWDRSMEDEHRHEFDSEDER